MTTEIKRGRGSRTAAQQYQLYVNLLESDVYFRENAFKPGEGGDFLKLKWDNLVRDLNSSGGPNKDLKAWKRTFSNWKSGVRAKARIIKNSFRETGNCMPPEVPLTSVEEKLLLYSGNVVVDGMNMPELGIVENPIFVENSTSLGPTPSVSGASAYTSYENEEELIAGDEEVNNLSRPTSIISGSSFLTESALPLPLPRRYNTLQAQSRVLTSTDTSTKILKSIENKLDFLVNLEKERLECEKQRLACDKEKLAFEKLKFSLKHPEFNMEEQ